MGIGNMKPLLQKQLADLVAHEVNDESHEVRWVEINNVHELPLHPSFAKSWPELMKLLNNLIGPA
jgi:8-oxo-dGTP diphosphatase